MKIFSLHCIHDAAGFSLRRFFAFQKGVPGRILRRLWVVGALILVASGAIAQGFLDLPPGKWWKNEDVIQALRLSPEQQQKLDDIMYSHLEQMIDLKAGFEKEELRLKQMLDLSKVDEKRLLDQVQRTLEAQNKMQMNRAFMFVKVRALLLPEQWEKIKVRFQREHRERRLQEMRERREGRDRQPEPDPGPPPGEGMM